MAAPTKKATLVLLVRFPHFPKLVPAKSLTLSNLFLCCLFSRTPWFACCCGLVQSANWYGKHNSRRRRRRMQICQVCRLELSPKLPSGG